MKLVETIITFTGEAKIVLTVPLPRYVLVACCADTSHVSNRQEPDFLREISGSEKSLSEAAAAGKRTAEARILNVLEFFGPLESPLSGSYHGGWGQHLGRRHGAPHLQRHQSCRHEDDGLRHRWRDRQASQQTFEAGIGDTC
jgi:hypothetical protein